MHSALSAANRSVSAEAAQHGAGSPARVWQAYVR